MVNGRVLVVEDDEHVRDAVARALRYEGYDVHTAVDGNDALAARRRDRARRDRARRADARHRRARRCAAACATAATTRRS